MLYKYWKVTYLGTKLTLSGVIFLPTLTAGSLALAMILLPIGAGYPASPGTTRRSGSLSLSGREELPDLTAYGRSRGRLLARSNQARASAGSLALVCHRHRRKGRQADRLPAFGWAGIYACACARRSRVPYAAGWRSRPAKSRYPPPAYGRGRVPTPQRSTPAHLGVLGCGCRCALLSLPAFGRGRAERVCMLYAAHSCGSNTELKEN